PGILHGRADLDFIAAKLGSREEPWQSGWQKLVTTPISSLDWAPAPVADVIRGSYNNPDIGSTAMMYDSASAYSHALQWIVTGDMAHAEKAKAILDGWSGTLKTITGSDQKLLAGITAYKFCNAAELLRY